MTDKQFNQLMSALNWFLILFALMIVAVWGIVAQIARIADKFS